MINDKFDVTAVNGIYKHYLREIMFETDEDFDFNDELFSTIFPSTNSGEQASNPAKRTNTNKAVANENNKRLCVIAPVVETANVTPAAPLKIENIFESKQQISLHRQNSITTRKDVQQRKCPGPAGLLPERRDMSVEIKTLESPSNTRKEAVNTAEEIVVCSQMAVSVNQNSTWQNMCKDFEVNNKNSIFLPDKYNIEWIKLKAKAKMLVNQKAPFLAAMVHNIQFNDHREQPVTLTLKDTTGEIDGTIVYDLYENYRKNLLVGAVIILKLVGVFTTEQDNAHHLVITRNNLVKIYNTSQKQNLSTKTHKTSDKNSQHFLESATINSDNENTTYCAPTQPQDVIVLQDLTTNDVLKIINNLKFEQNIIQSPQKNLISSTSGSNNLNESSKTHLHKFNNANVKLSNFSSCGAKNWKNLPQFTNNSPNFRERNINTRQIQNSVSCVLKPGNATSNNTIKPCPQFNFKTNLENDKKFIHNTNIFDLDGDGDFFNISFENSLQNINLGTKLKPSSSLETSKDISQTTQSDQSVNNDNKVLSQRLTFITSSQICVSVNKAEDTEIIQDAFDGIDADCWYDDF